MIEIFGKELTLEQVKGFVIIHEKDGEIRMPSNWVFELIEMAQKDKKIKERIRRIKNVRTKLHI
jgi:hypothetical protein